MYRPPHFAVDDLPTQQALIRAHPLGLLVVAGPDGLTADPIPFLLDAGEGPFGRLRCHVARANPVWRTIGAGAEVLVVFQAAEGYVTPGWYETKRETGKVVPTWNYALVQVHGRARAIEDTDWIATQIADLTALQEAKENGARIVFCSISLLYLLSIASNCLSIRISVSAASSHIAAARSSRSSFIFSASSVFFGSLTFPAFSSSFIFF